MLIKLWFSKNDYTLIAVNLSRQKELDDDPKAIQQIELVEQLKKLDTDDNATDEGNDQSMFVLTILEKIKRTKNYQEARVKLTNTRLNKLKSATKNKVGTILRLNKKTLMMENCYTIISSNKANN